MIESNTDRIFRLIQEGNVLQTQAMIKRVNDDILGIRKEQKEFTVEVVEEKINDEATLKEWKPKNKRKTKITKERLLELSNECQLGGKLIVNGEEIK